MRELSIREQVRGLFNKVRPIDEDEAGGAGLPSITSYQLAILSALQGRPVYRGTVSEWTKAKRRSKTSRQKASRKANRP